MKKIKILLLFIIFFSSFSLFSLTDKRALSQFMLDKWTNNTGLPQNSVLTMIQARNGYLWMGTEEGFVKFDGIHFKLYDMSNLPVTSHYTTSIIEDNKKPIVWVALSGGGLVKLNYDTNKFKIFTEKNGLPENNLGVIVQNKEGKLFISTDSSGIFSFFNNKAKVVVLPTISNGAGLSISTMVIDENDNLWYAVDNTLYEYLSSGKIEKKAVFKRSIHKLFYDKNSRIMVGTSGDGIYSYDILTQKTTKLASKSLGKAVISGIGADSKDNIYVGTNKFGLFRLKNDGKSTITMADKLNLPVVTSFLEDKEGSLWLGSRGGGLFRLKEGKFIVYSKRNGLKEDIIFPVTQGINGDIFIGTWGGGMYKISDGRISQITYKDILTKNSVVYSILQARNGDLWIGIGRKGLLKLAPQEENTKFYTVEDGLPATSPTQLMIDSKSNLWVGTRKGIVVFDKEGNIIKKLNASNGLPSNRIRHIYEDNTGGIFIATQKGLAYLKNGHIDKILPSLDSVKVMSVLSKNGKTFFTSEHGLFIKNETGKLFNVNMQNGLIINNLFDMIEDNNGNLWITSNKGIMKILADDIDNFISGKIKKMPVKVFGVTDGLLTAECDGGTQPTIWKTETGKLWFPTARGAVVIDPDNFKINEVKPPVDIVSFVVDEKEIPFEKNKKIELKPGVSTFEIKYTALSLLFPEKTKFKYKLEGVDDKWINAGTRRVAFYAKLKPGDYKFTVIAANNDDVWNEKGKSIEFEIEPHWYETWFFRIAVLFILFGIVGSFFKSKAKSVKKREDEMQRIISSRTGELKQMIKHVIDLSSKLETISTNVATNTKTTVEKFDNVHQRVNEASENLSEIASNLSTTKKDVISMNETVASLSTKASENESVLIDAVNSMTAIDQSAKEIQTIVEVVNEIAFKTNLLSLNAAIEAARAGEAGKGFAVVAESVRDLSNQSAQAVKSIQKLVNTAVENVDNGQHLVNKTADFVSEILNRFQSIGTMTQRINALIERHVSDAYRIDNSIQEIRDLTVENTALIKQVFDASQELNGIIMMLSTEIQNVKNVE